MRHAETDANKMFFRQNIVEILKNPSAAISPELQNYRSDPAYINIPINSTGISQCQNLQSVVGDLYPKIKHVVLSPMRRVIQTFENTFESHPNFSQFSKKITFMEDLRETIFHTADLAFQDSDEQNGIKYQQLYNFDFVKNYKHPKLWFFLNGNSKLETWGLRDLEHCKNSDEKKAKIVQKFRSVGKQDGVLRIEDQESCFVRTQRAKDKLRKLCEEEGLDDDELLVVTHGDTLRYLTCTSFEKKHKPVHGSFILFNNTKIISYDVSQKVSVSDFAVDSPRKSRKISPKL